METLIDTIRAATASDASAQSRAAGAQACRTILAALEAKAGEPLAQPPPPATPFQAVLTALSSTPPEHLIELLIEKLKAALPAGAVVPPIQSVRIPVVPISIGGQS